MKDNPYKIKHCNIPAVGRQLLATICLGTKNLLPEVSARCKVTVNKTKSTPFVVKTRENFIKTAKEIRRKCVNKNYSPHGLLDVYAGNLYVDDAWRYQNDELQRRYD